MDGEKREGEKVEGENLEIKKEKKLQNKQIITIIGVMVIIIASIFVSLYIAKSLQTFEYGGFEFKKGKQGDIKLYTANLISRLPTGEIANFAIAFRNDPRKLSNIPIEVDKIIISNQNTTYISIDESLEECGDAGIALVNLGLFFQGLGINPETGSYNRNFADENNISYINCDASTEDNTVIMIAESDENSIKQLSEYCYEVNYKNCEILKSLERFMVGMLAHSKNIKI